MKDILQAIAVTAELKGGQISPTACAVMTKKLVQYDKVLVLRALDEVSEGKGAFTLEAVKAAMERIAPDGRPGAEEAWAMLPRDEVSSVVWTSEMAEAYGVAAPLLAEGDAIAARMAFKEAYARIVERNKRQGMPAQWQPSLGSDAYGREVVLTEAARLGRLSHEQVAGLLPAPSHVGITAALLGNGPLLLESSGDPVADAQQMQEVAARIAALRDVLKPKCCA